MAEIKNIKIVTVWKEGKLVKDNINILRTPTKKVIFPISPQVKTIIEDLETSFRSIPCAGIAANQLGYNRKIFVGMRHDRDLSTEDASNNIDDVVPDVDNFEIYINPQIDKTDKKSTQVGSEGCLSIPGLSLNIERYDNIKVRYYNVEGKVIKKPLKGFISRLFQHELDHLEGRLMFEELIGTLELDQISKSLDAEIINALFHYIKK